MRENRYVFSLIGRRVVAGGGACVVYELLVYEALIYFQHRCSVSGSGRIKGRRKKNSLKKQKEICPW
jgi:hypothetical protein